jgi:uncharacterized Zn finger protein
MNSPTDFEFLVDESYENEKGVFTVVSIEKDEMLIRWKNGEEAQTSIEFQSRIQSRRLWERNREEKKAAAAQPAARKTRPARSAKKTPPASQ